MAELTKLQQAVAYQALYGALGPVVKANGDGLRGEVDRELRALYEQTGAKTYSVQVEGVKLGTYSVVENRAEPERVEVELDLNDAAKLSEWRHTDEGIDLAHEFVTEHLMEFASWCVEQGFLPNGVGLREVIVPARPASYKGGQIRVDKGFQEQVKMRMNTGLAALVAPASALLPEG